MLLNKIQNILAKIFNRKVFIGIIFILIIFFIFSLINNNLFNYEFSQQLETSETYYKLHRSNHLSIIEIPSKINNQNDSIDFQAVLPLGILFIDEKYRVIQKLPLQDDFNYEKIDKSINYNKYVAKTSLQTHIKILNLLKKHKENSIEFYYNHN